MERDRYLQVVDRPAPAFTLRTADGKTVTNRDYRGHVLVLWFVYASCPDVCPLHSEKIAEVQEMVNRSPMKDQVRFVAITTDPARDTAERMTGYAAEKGLDPANFRFLTADDPTATRALAKAFGLEFTLQEDGYQMHGVVTHLIDRYGRLRARYHGLKFDPTTMVIHVNALVYDVHSEP